MICISLLNFYNHCNLILEMWVYDLVQHPNMLDVFLLNEASSLDVKFRQNY
eukprot:GAHX01006935.1.p1 GENE.GAHX01006935.1~~GAHX01006935.1.p1  ORF type:complete len:51 (-),score=1.01 GAHX01006935.1:201-353(-)